MGLRSGIGSVIAVSQNFFYSILKGWSLKLISLCH
jgi:hypothetical protein